MSVERFFSHEVKKLRIPRAVVLWITAALLGTGVKDAQAQSPSNYRAPERGAAHFTLPPLPTATSEGQIVLAGHPETAPAAEVTLTAQANVKVRPQANTREASIYTLNKGNQATVLEQNSDGERVKGNSVWYLIQLEDGREGWVWAGAVLLNGSLDTAQNSSAPQTISSAYSSEKPAHSLANPEQATTAAETVSNGVTLAELSSYPSVIRGTFEGLSEDGVKPGRRVPYHVEVHPDQMAVVRDANGKPLPMGIFTERPNLASEIFPTTLQIDGVVAKLGYVSGILTHVEVDLFGGVTLGISVPIPATKKFALVRIDLGQDAQRVAFVSPTGTFVPYSSEKIKLGTDNQAYPGSPEGRSIYFSMKEQCFTYPVAGQLPSVHVGDQLVVRFIVNDEELSKHSWLGETQIAGSSNRDVYAVIANLTDRNPANDGMVLWSSMGFVLPTSTHNVQIASLDASGG